MELDDFKLETFFARWEFTVRYLLCSSDVEAVSLRDLLALAAPEHRALWENLSLGYTESRGHPELRREIASLYRAVSPDQVIVCSGAEEAIFVVMNVVCGPGDHAVVVTPCYQSLLAIPRAAGAEVTAIPLDREQGWGLDLDRLAAAVTPRTRLIVVNFPHSPTGALIDRAAFDRLVAIADRAGAYLFCDEVYRLLEHDPADRLPAGVDAYERGISLGVMSKVFGLAGLRIGWIASRSEELLRRAVSLKHYTTICNSAPSEILALIGLRARHTLLARAREIIAANLRRLDRFFDEHRHAVEWVRPRAGTVAFPRLLAPVAIDELAEELAAKRGALILPGSLFDYPGNHFRIGFGRRNLAEGLEKLAEALA